MRPISAAEIATLLSAAPAVDPTGRLALAIRIAARGGLRAAEVLSLRWQDCGHVDGWSFCPSATCRVRAADTKGGAKAALVHLSADDRQALSAHWASETEALGRAPEAGWPLIRGARPWGSLSYRRAEQLMRALVASALAGDPSVGWHSLRKFAATHVCDSGGLRAAQQFLRHRSIATTERYLGGVAEEDLAAWCREAF